MINLTKEEYKKKISIIRIFTISISGILLMFSLTQNAYYIEGMKDSVGSFGLIAFLLGWMDLGGAGISWLANPLLFLSWILMITKRYNLAILFGCLAVLFSLSFLCFENIIANEGGEESPIIAYDNGYWFWICSSISNFIGTCILFSKSKNSN